jgi:hypothetical protein
MRNTSARVITFLCKTVPNAKDLQKLGTLEIRIIIKKRKIYVPCFHSKFEVEERERERITKKEFLLLCFLKKSHIFPKFFFPPTSKATQNLLSIFVCCIIVNKNT